MIRVLERGNQVEWSDSLKYLPQWAVFEVFIFIGSIFISSYLVTGLTRKGMYDEDGSKFKLRVVCYCVVVTILSGVNFLIYNNVPSTENNQGVTELETVPLTPEPDQILTSSEIMTITPGIAPVSTDTYNSPTPIENDTTSIVEEPGKIELEFNKFYKGKLTNKEDIDAYYFSVKEPTNLTLHFITKNTNRESSVFVVALSDENKYYSVTEIPGNVENYSPGNIYVDSGEYQVTVNKGIRWIDSEYQLEIEAKPLENAEIEPNDYYETASEIKLSSNTSGSFQEDSDVDYYWFQIEKDGFININMSYKASNSSKTYGITVLDDGQKPIYQQTLNGMTQVPVLPLAVKTGKYYLKVNNLWKAHQDYTIRVDYHETELVENEPNDDSAAATNFSIGERISGSLINENDSDYYHFALEEDKKIYVEFIFTPQENVNLFKFTMDGTSMWNPILAKGTDGGFKTTYPLSKGDHYIRVESVTWKPVVYNILTKEEEK